MKSLQPYKSLIHTLKSLKNQSIEGVGYMKKQIPSYLSEPRDLFYYLKDKVTYQHDPKGIELIHSPQSLFEDNYHGKPGAGDCDCFTALSIAALKAMGVPEAKIKVCLTPLNGCQILNATHERIQKILYDLIYYDIIIIY